MTSESPTSKQTPETPSVSGSRNLHTWTAFDRENMYKRRQSGEAWDTICKDFPERTRHAMQQQFSMMKNQKSKANGTYTPGNRGRKRRVRVPASHRWEAVNLPDSDSTVSDLSEDDDDTSITSYRPPNSSRSASDPSKSEEQDGPLFPNLQADVTAKSGDMVSRPDLPELTVTAKIVDEGAVADATPPQHPSKKRKFSVEPTKLSESSLTEDYQVKPNILAVSSSEDFLSPEDAVTIQRILSRANDTVKARLAAAEADRLRRQELFDAALSRASRRANEAELKLKEEVQKRLDIVKSKDEIIESKDKGYAEAIEDLTAKLTAKVNDNAAKVTIETLEKSLAERDSALATKEQQLRLYDQLRDQICSEVTKLSEAHEGASQIEATIAEHQPELDRKLRRLDVDFTDIRLKTLRKYMDDVEEECKGIQATMAATVTQWQAARKAVVAFRTQFPSKEPEKGALDTPGIE